jgi:L-asparaginase
MLTALLLPVAIEASDLPTVHIIGTGGTIAADSHHPAGGKYDSGQIPIEEIIRSVPGISAIANIEFTQLANIPSQDMTESVWFQLATAVDSILGR